MKSFFNKLPNRRVAAAKEPVGFFIRNYCSLIIITHTISNFLREAKKCMAENRKIFSSHCRLKDRLPS